MSFNRVLFNTNSYTALRLIIIFNTIYDNGRRNFFRCYIIMIRLCQLHISITEKVSHPAFRLRWSHAAQFN